jgi:hypothetical protein
VCWGTVELCGTTCWCFTCDRPVLSCFVKLVMLMQVIIPAMTISQSRVVQLELLLLSVCQACQAVAINKQMQAVSNVSTGLEVVGGGGLYIC